MSLSEWSNSYRAAIRTTLGQRQAELAAPASPSELAGTGLPEALDELLERYRAVVSESSALATLSERINSSLLLDEVMDHVFVDFRALLPYQRIGVALLDEAGSTACTLWARSDLGPLCLPLGYSAPLAGSSLQHVLATGQPRILNDLECHLRAHPASESTALMLSEGIRASLTCPLVAGGKPIGFVFFSARQANTYQPVHLERFSKLAGQLSYAVHRAQLHQRVLEANHRLQQANAELERLATEDALTGLCNRRSFDTALGAEWRRSCRDGGLLSLVMADVDQFKSYNDTYGHLRGDECLRQVSRVFAEDLIAHADAALYEAKGRGGNCVASAPWFGLDAVGQGSSPLRRAQKLD